MSSRQIPPQYKTIKRDGKKINWAAIITGIIALALLISGGVMIYSWVNNGGAEAVVSVIYTETPTLTPTATATPVTPTLTPTATMTPTITLSPTITNTATPSDPFPYTVESGDSMYTIAEKFNIEMINLMLINGLNNQDILEVGQVITVPAPGTILPTSTPIPDDLAKGSPIQYIVMPDDSLASIANKFLSTIEDIIEANGIEDADLIQVGDPLIIRVNLVTPTPTPLETVTPQMTPTPGS